MAVGLNKNPADKGQDPKIDLTKNEAAGSITQWVAQKSNGQLGTAIIVPDGFAGFAEDNQNLLALAKATPGKPLRYFAGAGWNRSGQFSSKEEWNAYVAAAAARAKSPVRVALQAK